MPSPVFALTTVESRGGLRWSEWLPSLGESADLSLVQKGVMVRYVYSARVSWPYVYSDLRRHSRSEKEMCRAVAEVRRGGVGEMISPCQSDSLRTFRVPNPTRHARTPMTSRRVAMPRALSSGTNKLVVPPMSRRRSRKMRKVQRSDISSSINRICRPPRATSSEDVGALQLVTALTS